METEYSSYRLGLMEKRATWLVTWVRDKVQARKVTAKEMAQGLGRLGFAAISLDWERPFLGHYMPGHQLSGAPGPDDDTHHAEDHLQLAGRQVWRGVIGSNARRNAPPITWACPSLRTLRPKMAGHG